MKYDVVIIGAGAIGCASAWLLARRGLDVLVLEKGAFALEAASRAAAGMLSAQLESHASEAMARLCMASRERWRDFAAGLGEASGVDVGLCQSGALKVAFDDRGAGEIEALVAEQRRRGWSAEIVGARAARELEPELGEVAAAAYFPGEMSLDPPKLLDALRIAAERAGARFRTTAEVTAIRDDAGANGVTLRGGETIASRYVVVAAGAWSALIAAGLPAGSIRPVRGQMLELIAPPPLFRRLVEGPEAYLSPRADGRILVGSTLEEVGFERAVTAAAASHLLAGAMRLGPRLANAALRDHWCGFRAAARDGLPLLGELREGLIIATGHFRNGIVLTPITAELVAALITREPMSNGPSPATSSTSAALDLAPFAPTRAALTS